MEQRYKVVVFDLDGTLLDTSEGIMASVRYAVDYFGFKPLSEEEIRKFFGPPIQDSFARALNLERDMVNKIVNVFRENYKDENFLKAVPYEGILDVFQTLCDKGMKPAIATYKKQSFATELLTHFGFNKYTDIIFGADDENKLTKKDIIEKALMAAGAADYSEAVMIGDSENDAIGAEKIGISFIGVTYGFGFKSDDDVNKFPNAGVAHDTKELLNLILKGQKNEN